MAGDSDINDQLKQQANAARIRAIRQLQRQVAKDSGGERVLTRKQANAMLRSQLMEDFQKAQPQVAKAEQMEAQVRGWVQQEMQKFRISGQGVTGSGFSWVIDFPQNEQDDRNDDESDATGQAGAGEGVFADSLGDGLDLIIDSEDTLTSNVEVRSLDESHLAAIKVREQDDRIFFEWFYADAASGLSLVKGIQPEEGAVFKVLDTTAEKSIAVGEAGDVIFFEWFYSNTTEGSGYINLITEIDPEDGATFRAIKTAGEGVSAELDGSDIIFKWKAENIGEGDAEVWTGEFDEQGNAQFRTISGTERIKVDEQSERIEVDLKPLVPSPAGTFAILAATVDQFGRVTSATEGQAGITQLTGDVTAGPGNGAQPATIAPLAVTNDKIANDTIGFEKFAENGASDKSIIQYDITAQSWVAVGARWQEVEFKNPTTGECSTGFVLVRT